MTTNNKVPYGKPDAGKPHVRFDEGEVASAKPRRGSLLYKTSRLPISALAMIISSAAFAATINVPGDYASIADAVSHAGDGDTVQLAAQTFVVNDKVEVTHGLRIVGQGPGLTFITRDGQSYKNKKLFILTNAGASIENLTVKNVYAQDVGGTSGAIFEFPNTTGSGSLSNLVVTGCTAGSSGAGYICYIGTSASATVSDVQFIGNTMRESGGSGVIFANNPSSATVERCSFIGNRSFTTGALRVNSRCKVVSCTFADNWNGFTVPASARGGALYLENVGANMSFSNCVFFADRAWYDASEMAPEVNQQISANLTNRFNNCAWDSKVPAIGKGAVSITESDFTDVYAGDFSPYANSALVTAAGTIGSIAPSAATGPAYTPTGPAEISLAVNASINDAVFAAPEGQIINLAEGIYSVTGTLWIAKGLKLKGAGRDKTFLMREGSSYNSAPYLRIDNGEACVSDLTISNVTATANNQAGVLFITARGGKFIDSRITRSKGAGAGSGAAIGLAGGTNSIVSRCYINANSVNGSSGNSIIYMWGGVLDNSLVCKNTYITQGCVSMRGSGRIYNCTFADNTCRSGNAQYVCAGIYWMNANNFNPKQSRIYNTVFTRGTSAEDSSTGHPEWYNNGGTAAQFEACFRNCGWGSSVPVIGDGSVSVTDDGFADASNQDFHLKTSSAAYERGFVYDGIAGKDLEGNNRQQGDYPDIGCFETIASGFSVEIKVSPTVGFIGDKFRCTPVITGISPEAIASCRCHWRFVNESLSVDDETSGSSEFDAVFASAGIRSVYLDVYDANNQLIGSATPVLNYLNVGVTDCFVADPEDASVTPVYPYATAGTAAKTNLATMVNAAVPGQTIHVLAGRIDVGGPVDISGLSVVGQGWDSTVLTNAAYNPGSSDLFPFIILNSADSLLDNLCISNVLTYSNGASLINIGTSGGKVSRVKIIRCRGGNASNGYIVGLFGDNSVFSNCWLADNEVQPNGKCGAIYIENGLIENTLVDETRGMRTGGGIICGGKTAVIRNTTVTRCRRNSYWSSDNSFAGLVFCEDFNYPDGGTTCGYFVNCVSACNDLCDQPGIGGSAWRGCETKLQTLANSISNCAFTADAMLVGINPKTVDPVRDFKNVANGDFRPRQGSPLFRTGLYGTWMESAVDLAGRPRATSAHRVDIGAYQGTADGMTVIFK